MSNFPFVKGIHALKGDIHYSLREEQPWTAFLRRFSFAWPADGPKRCVQAHRLGRCRHPTLISIGLASLHAAAQTFQFGFGLWLVNDLQPILVSWYGAWMQERQLGRDQPPRQARPGPILGTLHQVGSQRVSFDVTQDREEVLILLNRERLESSLPYVAARMIVLVVTPHVRGHEPLHPLAQLAILPRPNNQVEVVRHQTVGQEAHVHAGAADTQQAGEGCIVSLD